MKYLLIFIIYLAVTILFAYFLARYLKREDTQKAFKELNEARSEFKEELIKAINAGIERVRRVK